MSPILLSILLGLTAAAANVFGGAIIVQKNWDRSYLRYFVALGAGFMLATALVEMVPESLELAGRRKGALLVLAGYLLVHLFEHTITPHFHYGEETHSDEYVHSHRRVSVLFGLLIHTFFDGIAITSGFLVSPWLGWIIFLAVFLHKIPEGFTVTSVMLASGLSKQRSWFASVLLGLATLAGVLTMAIGQSCSELRIAGGRRRNDLRCRLRPHSRGQSRAGREDGAGSVHRRGRAVPARSLVRPATLRIVTPCPPDFATRSQCCCC